MLWGTWWNPKRVIERDVSSDIAHCIVWTRRRPAGITEAPCYEPRLLREERRIVPRMLASELMRPFITVCISQKPGTTMRELRRLSWRPLSQERETSGRSTRIDKPPRQLSQSKTGDLLLIDSCNPWTPTQFWGFWVLRGNFPAPRMRDGGAGLAYQVNSKAMCDCRRGCCIGCTRKISSAVGCCEGRSRRSKCLP